MWWSSRYATEDSRSYWWANFVLLLQERKCFMLQHHNVGISESTITTLRRECTIGGTDISSPTKHYKLSRCQTLVDDTDREAIRKRFYQLYEAKEHLTFAKLVVRNLSFIVLQQLLSCDSMLTRMRAEGWMMWHSRSKVLNTVIQALLTMAIVRCKQFQLLDADDANCHHIHDTMFMRFSL